MSAYETHTLSNGLRIIYLPQDTEVVYCGYAIRCGARNELPNEEGLAHFCEHTTFKGTERMSSLQVINSLERVGGELNAYTAKEETVYYAAILRKYLNRAVDTLTEIVFHSTYRQSEIEKEVEVVCDEIDSYRDTPAELIYDEFENKLFRNHPLGHNVLGTKDTVRLFTSDDCKRFTSAWYTPANMVFYVLGNVDFTKLVRRLEGLLSGFAAAQPTLLPHQGGDSGRTDGGNGIIIPEQTIYRDDQLQTHQSHVMQGVAFTDNLERWRIPLFVVNNMLGGPCMNSRFNLALRERSGLVYTVESLMTTYSDAILWSVYFGCDNKDVTKCLNLIQTQLRRLQEKPLPAATLSAVKTQLKGQIALANQNKENAAIEMAKQYLHRGTLRDIKRLCGNVDAVTSADIHYVAKEILAKENLCTLIYL